MLVYASAIVAGDTVTSSDGIEFDVTLVAYNVKPELFGGNMSIFGQRDDCYYIEHLDSDDVVNRVN